MLRLILVTLLIPSSIYAQDYCATPAATVVEFIDSRCREFANCWKQQTALWLSCKEPEAEALREQVRLAANQIEDLTKTNQQLSGLVPQIQQCARALASAGAGQVQLKRTISRLRKRLRRGRNGKSRRTL